MSHWIPLSNRIVQARLVLLTAFNQSMLHILFDILITVRETVSW
jgi:hypothetical protein